MPEHQGTGFWGGKQYQDLAKLRLPGPAVVIDVRQGSDYDPPLIWNLAIELEDLTTEMWLNQVYRWRKLGDCIDFLKLRPLRAGEPIKEKHDFVITTRTGQTESIQGVRSLTERLGEHLNTVRTNRMHAALDRDQNPLEQHRRTADPEQTTVRVFFLVDAEDIDSLESAATYAEWLKQWYHEYDEPGRSGRDKRISTIVICMNADPYRHHLHALAPHLNRTSSLQYPALDAVILLHTYADNEIFIGGEIQSYHVELILFILLLLSQESLAAADEERVDVQSLSPYVYSEEFAKLPTLPWSIWMMGISSLEYSARWTGRWLDYRLVAKVIEIIQDSQEVEQEEQLRWLSRKVREKLREWQQAVDGAIPDAYTSIIPELQVLDEFQRYLVSFPARGKERPSSIEDLNAFSRRISQLYIGESNSLKNAMESAPLIPWQLKREAMQLSRDNTDRASQVDELYQKLLALQDEVAQLPAALFYGSRGMLPRVLRQVSELTEAIAEIRELAENPPDLEECREELECEAKKEQEKLAQGTSSQSWPFGGKSQQQYEKSRRRLSEIARSHLNKVRAVIAARVALVLLQEAGLYVPGGKLCPYHQRLKLLDTAMKTAHKQAILQQKRAYERLQPSLAQLSLNSRKDLLNWEQVVKSSEQLETYLESDPEELQLLTKWLLRLLGSEKPLIILQRHLREMKDKQQLSLPRAKELEKEYLQAFSTMLVDVLLLLDIANFDTSTIQPLVEQYIDLKDHSSEEPSILEGNILGLQHTLKEAQTTHSTLGNKNAKQALSSIVPEQEQPAELVLAAWINNQRANDSKLSQTLDRTGILARLAEHKIKPIDVLDDLRERNRLLGYRDGTVGQDRFYLLLGPGEVSNEFLKELDRMHSSTIRPVHFPDAEKLIYLHIYRIRQVLPRYLLSTEKQLSPKQFNPNV